MFPTQGSSIDILAISKTSKDSIITKEAFKELLQFHNHIFEAEFINEETE